MIKKIITVFLIVSLIADLSYSFLNYYHTPLDGDMASGIIPAPDVRHVLNSPLGFDVFKTQTTYPNPNRFFCHWSFYEYFNRAPLFLQNYTDPINSAYLSSAIAKTLIHLTILFFIAFFITGKVFKFDFLLASFLITPLFQTNGYREIMGIIDPATTYTFFYALPIILLLIYFTPLMLNYYFGREVIIMKYLKYFWIPLALISSLSGPLNPGVSLVISLLIFSKQIFFNLRSSKKRNWLLKLQYSIRNIPNEYLFYLIPISIFSMYSLYLGRFNSISLSHEISVWTLYTKVPQGIFNILTQKIAFPVLFLILLINTLIIRFKFLSNEGRRILNTFKWIGIFSLVYILLLPLGGYREYRPYILRYDTIIPVTLSLFFIFGKTTIFIINNLSVKQHYWYIPIIALVVFIYANSDRKELKKLCEKSSIEKIANSNEEIVEIHRKCNILSWSVIENPQDSKIKSELLKRWKIINHNKLFYYKPLAADSISVP